MQKTTYCVIPFLQYAQKKSIYQAKSRLVTAKGWNDGG